MKNYKKILAIVFSFSIVLSIFLNSFFTSASNQILNGKCGESVEYELDLTTGILTLSGFGDVYDYNANENKSPFNGRTDIKSVVIKDGVRHIGSYTFENCSSLKLLKFADTVFTLGENAFSNCSNLTTVIMGRNLNEIYNYAFTNSNNISRVMILSPNITYENKRLNSVLDLLKTGSTIYAYRNSGVETLLQGNTDVNFVLLDDNKICEECIGTVSLKNQKAATKTEPGYSGDYICDSCNKIYEQGVVISKLNNPPNVSIKGPKYVLGTDTIDLVFAFSGNKISGITCNLEYDDNQVELVKIRKPFDETLKTWCLEANGKNIIAYDNTLENSISTSTNMFVAEFKMKNLAANTKTNISLENIVVSDGKYDDIGENASFDITIHQHNVVVDAGKRPTCTDSGLTEGSHCSSCGKVLQSQKIIPPLGHTEVIDEAKLPTCTETGLTEGSHCSSCGKIFKVQEIIPALGHNEVIVKGKAATCLDNGLSDKIYCSVCGKVIKEQLVIPALGHVEVIDEAKLPTCTETGLTEGSHCSTCGKIFKVQETVPALGHTVVIDKAVPATYLKTGLTEGKHCSVCGKALVRQKIIDILPIKSSKFFVSEKEISKIYENTTVSSFISHIDGGDFLDVFKGKYKLNPIEKVGTGMLAKLIDGETIKKEYRIIVTGDTNGDGQITITDMIAVKANILKKTNLLGAYKIAGDTNGDGAVTITDFIQIKSKILGKSKLIPR